MRYRWLALTMTAAACASGGGGASGSPRPALPAGSSTTNAGATSPRPVRGGANLITAGELATVAGRAQNAFEVVQALRPAMLRARASGGQETSGRNMASIAPHVFLDTSPFGDISSLRTIGYEQIREIRFVNASDATTLWGTGYPSGVIQVITKK